LAGLFFIHGCFFLAALVPLILTYVQIIADMDELGFPIHERWFVDH